MAVGNTFGATALSSYGGFWISFAIVLTPGGFEIEDTLETTGGKAMFDNSFGLMLFVSFSMQLATRVVMAHMLTSISGLVHLHHYPPLLHPEIDGGLLPAVFLPGPDLPAAGYWVHPP